ncbi:hypothetical protein [Kiloniella sp. b19]|uniref:hypothetical protein n=1 Tax=Kiloniella sp. GXU_MW_B19 TaxID=3141326 RepID=UPI0031D5FC9C
MSTNLESDEVNIPASRVAQALINEVPSDVVPDTATQEKIEKSIETHLPDSDFSQTSIPAILEQLLQNQPFLEELESAGIYRKSLHDAINSLKEGEASPEPLVAALMPAPAQSTHSVETHFDTASERQLPAQERQATESASEMLSLDDLLEDDNQDSGLLADFLKETPPPAPGMTGNTASLSNTGAPQSWVDILNDPENQSLELIIKSQ